MGAFGCLLNCELRDLVDLVGIEPTTSSMPWKRAPSCATGPLFKAGQLFILAAVCQIVKRRLSLGTCWSPMLPLYLIYPRAIVRRRIMSILTADVRPI